MSLSAERLQIIQNYQPGDWFQAETPDELQAFFQARLPAIQQVGRELGFAIAVHGSMRRDLDLIAIPWIQRYSSRDLLAHAIAMAACGLTREGSYVWETKPHNRFATSIPICWSSDHQTPGMGHVDLSVIEPVEIQLPEHRFNPAPLIRLCQPTREVKDFSKVELITITPVRRALKLPRGAIYRLIDPSSSSYDPSFPKPWFIWGRLRFDKQKFMKWFSKNRRKYE